MRKFIVKLTNRWLFGSGTETATMPKADRKERILQLLAETDLALPPRAIYVNLSMQGATFSYKTVHRHLQELRDEGLVENPPEKEDYYMIKSAGRQFLESDT